MSTLSRLEKLKAQAAILLKKFNSDDALIAQKATERFLKLPFLKHSNIEAVQKDKEFFRLKHSYQVLAIEHGHNNWKTLREQIIKEECMYHPSIGVYLNIWFGNYNEAWAYHKKNGGYLLYYRQYYYVCDKEAIRSMGLDTFDKEWKAIGYNAVKPESQEAYSIIYKRAKANYLNRKPGNRTAFRSKRPNWV